MRARIVVLLLPLLTALAAPAPAVAACDLTTTANWTGTTGDWNTPANWSTGTVPDACTHVILRPDVAGGTATISGVPAETHVLSLEVQWGVRLQGGPLVSDGTLFLELSTERYVHLNLPLKVLGDATVIGTGTLDAYGGRLTLSGGSYWSGDAFVNLGSGKLDLAGITRVVGPALEVLGDDGAGSAMTVAGTVKVLGGAITGPGRFHVRGIPAAVSGTVAVDAASEWIVDGTRATLADGTRLIGPGRLRMTGFNSEITPNGAFALEQGAVIEMESGYLTGPARIEGSGTLVWQGGTLRGALNIDAALHVTGSQTHNLGQGTSIDLAGDSTWDATGLVRFPSEAETLVNSGVMTLAGATVDTISASAPWDNRGTVQGEGFLDVVFTNGGLLEPGWELYLAQFQQAASGTLGVSLGESIATSGPAVLAGTLAIHTPQGWTPPVNATYDFLGHQGRTGTFDAVTGGEIDGTRALVIDYSQSHLTRLRVGPTVRFGVNPDAPVDEPTEGQAAGGSLLLSAPSDVPVKVRYAPRLVDGSDAAGEADFAAGERVVTIYPGELARTATVPTVQDDADETPERFAIDILSADYAGVVAPTRREARILDDDVSDDKAWVSVDIPAAFSHVLVYHGGQNSDDVVSVQHDPLAGKITVEAEMNTIEPWLLCESVTERKVVCDAPPTLHSVILSGGGGDDRLGSYTSLPTLINGGPGDDVLTGSDANDVLCGDSAKPAVPASVGTTCLASEAGGDDRIAGKGGDDYLDGGGGDNRLAGSTGDDLLVSHGAVDTLIGDLGADCFVGGGPDRLVTVDYSGAPSGVNVTTNGAADDGAPGEGDNVWCANPRTNPPALAAAPPMVRGTKFADLLTGGGGDDRFDGGTGPDLITGGEGTDTVTYESRAERVVLTLDDTANDGAAGEEDDIRGSEVLIGGSGGDTLRGDSGAQWLQGGPGADELYEGGGTGDRLSGGDGFDAAGYGDRTAALRLSADGVADDGEAGEQDRIDPDVESIGGGSGPDHLTGSPGADDLSGFGGDDVIDGRGGADRLFGGDGTDTASYAADPAGVSVDLLASQGGPAGAPDTLDAVENVTGSPFADVLRGDGGANRLDGGPGDDTLNGRLGADVLSGGDGGDLASYADRATSVTVTLDDAAGDGGAGEGDDVRTSVEAVTGGAGADELTGSGLANTLRGGPGADTIKGGGGADTLEGGAGGDDLSGGDGTDTVTYEGRQRKPNGQCDPECVVQGATVTVDGVAGDGVTDADGAGVGGAGARADNVRTDVEVVVGTASTDVFGAGPTATTFLGLDGDDLLQGGAGADVLDGGGGHDTADYSARTAPVTVGIDLHAGDGEAGEDDRVTPTVEEVLGGSGNDALTGHARGTTLRGNGGSDVLTGLGGQDTVDARDGALDTVTCGEGDDEVDADDGDTVQPDCETTATGTGCAGGFTTTTYQSQKGNGSFGDASRWSAGVPNGCRHAVIPARLGAPVVITSVPDTAEARSLSLAPGVQLLGGKLLVRGPLTWISSEATSATTTELTVRGRARLGGRGRVALGAPLHLLAGGTVSAEADGWTLVMGGSGALRSHAELRFEGAPVHVQGGSLDIRDTLVAAAPVTSAGTAWSLGNHLSLQDADVDVAGAAVTLADGARVSGPGTLRAGEEAPLALGATSYVESGATLELAGPATAGPATVLGDGRVRWTAGELSGHIVTGAELRFEVAGDGLKTFADAARLDLGGETVWAAPARTAPGGEASLVNTGHLTLHEMPKAALGLTGEIVNEGEISAAGRVDWKVSNAGVVRLAGPWEVAARFVQTAAGRLVTAPGRALTAFVAEIDGALEPLDVGPPAPFGTVVDVIVCDAACSGAFTTIDAAQREDGLHWAAASTAAKVTATVTDPDPPAAAIEDAEITEDEAGVALRVTLSHAEARPIGLTVGANDGTAGADDYRLLTGTLEIPAGATAAEVDLAIQTDAVEEPDETLTVSLTAAHGGVTIEGGAATVTIADDDGDAEPEPTPTPTPTPSPQPAAEPTAAPTAAPTVAPPAATPVPTPVEEDPVLLPGDVVPKPGTIAKGVPVEVDCGGPCTVDAVLMIDSKLMARAAKLVPLGKATTTLAAGGTARLKVRPTKKAARRLRKRRSYRAVLQVTVSTPGGGTSAPVRKKVTLRR